MANSDAGGLLRAWSPLWLESPAPAFSGSLSCFRSCVYFGTDAWHRASRELDAPDELEPDALEDGELEDVPLDVFPNLLVAALNADDAFGAEVLERAAEFDVDEVAVPDEAVIQILKAAVQSANVQLDNAKADAARTFGTSQANIESVLTKSNKTSKPHVAENIGSADLAGTIFYNLLKMNHKLSIESITCVRTEGVLMFQYGAKFPI